MTTSTGNLFGQKNLAVQLAAFAAGRAGLLVFAGTLLLSASLLFSVQPLFAKMVLPHLGGSPSVWAVAMCFFQAALLAGYCYAHALNRFAPAWLAPLVHLLVCALAVLTLPFALPAWAHEVPSGNQYWWLVTVLAVGIGLPFFATSANAPLLQAWFSRSGHPHANDPYFLYGASNLGSLASLLAYPFLIEPLLGVEAQRAIWAAGFITLMIMLAGCAILMLSSGKGTTDAVARPATLPAKSVTATDRLVWIGLAFVPSALLVAFTTHITTDIASAPFLWVLPLAAFLGTFVIVFRDHSMIPHGSVLRAHPVLVASAIIFVVMPGLGGAALQGLVGFATFFVTTLVCHRALYEQRPAAQKLTEFYLFMSLGGVLGGMFAALLAPQLFNTVAEYPLLIILGLFARPGVLTAVRSIHAATLTPRQWVLALGPVAAIVVMSTTGLAPASTLILVATFTAFVIAGVIAALPHRKDWFAIASVLAIVVSMSAATSMVGGYNERSFFGVSRVLETADGRYRLLIHGSTTHGGQRLRDDAGNVLERPEPILYYHANAPMARGFELARRSAAGKLSVGVVGLGTGSLACYLQPGEKIVYFEIDPVVVSIARNAAQFTYLSRCAPAAEMVIGDARLTLAKQPEGAFDYLVVDAFSSDAVPVHLLTREALQLYLSRIAENGLIAIHISNRHMELESVVAATAASFPGVNMAAVLKDTTKRAYEDHPSHVVFLSRDRAVIDRALATVTGARQVNPRNTHPWSDNYADVLGAIWRRYTN